MPGRCPGVALGWNEKKREKVSKRKGKGVSQWF
jgi:hypothetical protein